MAIERNWPARGALLLFLIVLCWIAFTREGVSWESIDVRQYGEMMDGVRKFGLPIVDNGPATRFIPLQVPWSIVHNGHLWGTYTPLYPYLAAPFLGGGVARVGIATATLMIPIALVSFALARRVLESEWYAALAGIAAVGSTPILGKSLETTAYPLSVLMTTATAYAAIIATSSRSVARQRVAAVAAGFLCACAIASHLLSFPPSMLALVTIAIAYEGADDSVGPKWLDKTFLRGLWPTRRGIELSVIAIASMVVSLIPVALLNHRRFGSYNPVSYGPMPWSNGGISATAGEHLMYGLPLLTIIGAILVAWIISGLMWGTEGRRPRLGVLIAARVASFVLASLLIYKMPELRERTWRIWRIAWIFVVDNTVFELEPPYHRMPGAIGNMVGPWVLKSMLQATPLLGLVVVLGRVESIRAKRRLAMLLIPGLALIVYLGLRGNLPITPAVGWAWVYQRYTLCGVPIFLVAALYVVKSLKPTRLEWLAAPIALVPVVYLYQRHVGDDMPDRYIRQVVLIVVPLLLLVICWIIILLARHTRLPRFVAALAVTTLVGFGFGIGYHDYRAHLTTRAFAEWRLATAAEVLPQRFGLIGVHWAFDQVLGLRMTRDVQYGDLAMVAGNWDGMRPLVDYWMNEDARPVFFIAEDNGQPVSSPWPDIELVAVRLDQRIYRLEKRTTTALNP